MSEADDNPRRKKMENDLSKFKRSTLRVVQDPENPNIRIQMLKKRVTNNSIEYRCNACRNINRRKGAEVRPEPTAKFCTLTNEWLTSPIHPRFPHFCLDEEYDDSKKLVVLAKQEYRKCVRAQKADPIKPKRRYIESLHAIGDQYNAGDTEAMKAVFPNQDAVRQALYRATQANRVDLDPVLTTESVLTRKLVTTRHSALSDDQPISWQEAVRVIPEGDRIILHIEDEPNFQFVVFGSVESLRILHDCEVVNCDGNFKLNPKSYYQLYSFVAVHGVKSQFHHVDEHNEEVFDGPVIKQQESFSVLHVLMTGKSEGIYQRMFDVVCGLMRRNLGGIGPAKTFKLDCEIAAIAALEASEFCTVYGCRASICLFHVSQANVKWFGENNHMREFRNSESLRIFAKSHVGVAFVPIEDVPLAMHELREFALEQLPHHSIRAAIAFHDYFMRFYLPKILLWNHYQQTANRTTNNIEASWRKLADLLLMSHPALWLFIEKVIALDQLECDRYRLIRGHPERLKTRDRTMIHRDMMVELAKQRYQRQSQNGGMNGQIRMAHIRHIARLITKSVPNIPAAADLEPVQPVPQPVDQAAQQDVMPDDQLAQQDAMHAQLADAPVNADQFYGEEFPDVNNDIQMLEFVGYADRLENLENELHFEFL